MLEYTSTVVLKFTGNDGIFKSKEEYIKWVKESFLEDYGIFLETSEIHNIQEHLPPEYNDLAREESDGIF
jgi:hypothetical protein